MNSLGRLEPVNKRRLKSQNGLTASERNWNHNPVDRNRPMHGYIRKTKNTSKAIGVAMLNAKRVS